MQHGKYTIKEFISGRNVNQILIPEIQRDYVWNVENVAALLKSIKNDATGDAEQTSSITEEQLNALNPFLREQVLRTIQENRKFSNIGFIYAYSDAEVINKYYLIDGQQRLTTIFLIMLAVSVKTNKHDNFRNAYFINQAPKLDYKVREASQSFFRKFIEFILNNGKIEDLKKQYWYFSEYEHDVTIQSLINNYTYIQSNVGNITFEFIEDNIEIWFFDTNKSEQGEELYIYMNSRGESVQPNENIKAQLLAGYSDTDKHKWGAEWEKWQGFFWSRRGANENADKGFNEFLKWIIILEKKRNEKGAKITEQGDYIKQLKEAKKFDSEYLTLDAIRDYYNALLVLSSYEKDLEYLNPVWYAGDTSIVDYIRLFPLLMYVKSVQNIVLDNIKRLSRFFMNIARSEDIAKNPTDQCVHVMNLCNQFLSNKYIDVADLLEFKDSSSYQNILTKEEIFKLSLYKNPPTSVSRQEIENVFWEVEDFNLCFGRIEFLMDCINYSMYKDSLISFNFVLFHTYSKLFIDLFKNPTDLLRKALLSKGDYAIKDGYTSKLECDRYSLVIGEQWKQLIKDYEKNHFVKGLLNDCYVRVTNKLKPNNEILTDIITDYQNQPNIEKDWKYHFISNPKILEYCQDKKFCYISDDFEDIYLLAHTKATSYDQLSHFIG